MSKHRLKSVVLLAFNDADIRQCLPDDVVLPEITQQQLDQIGEEMWNTFWDRIGDQFWEHFFGELYEATKKVIDLKETEDE